MANHLRTSFAKPPRIAFMATCLCDAFYDGVARAAVEILEYLGCEVVFPPDQTCCGQPALNAGDWDASRQVIRHVEKVFRGSDPIVLPSGSCASMILHGYALAMEKESDRQALASISERTWEICDFIVHGLGCTHWGGRYARRVAFHRSCHTRGGQSAEAAQALLRSIDGLTLTAFGESEQCCGFGGTFSVSFPNVSAAMGRLKLEHMVASQPEELAAVDMACLLHLGGLCERDKRDLPRRHVVEILRDALRATGQLP